MDETLYCDCCCGEAGGELERVREGALVCEDCLASFYFTCPVCGEFVHEDDEVICDRCGESCCPDCTHADSRETLLCEYCYEQHTFICCLCGDVVHEDDEVICDWCGESCCPDCIHTDSRGTLLCEYCYEQHAFICCLCGEFVHEDDVRTNEGSGDNFCPECYQDICPIERYDYAPPEFIFYGDDDSSRRYIGIELEVDDGDDREECSAAIREMAREVYMKHDGSLAYGFEIVSHPATLEYHAHQLPWREIMEVCREHGFLSHDASTCGLHLHVSRSAFGAWWEAEEAGIARFLYLFEKFWNPIRSLSRRTDQQINSWARRYGIQPDEPRNEASLEKFFQEAKDLSNSSRYYSVNLQNRDTVEVRIFRGTLRHTTFIATIQLVDLLVDIAAKKSTEEIHDLTWFGFLDQAEKAGHQELLQYARERGVL